MSKTVIKVENLSKQYRLGEVGTGTLSHDLNRWWHRIRGKEDPYLKIGEANDRASRGSSEYVWALRDINFEVQQGEVLGIIGKNGAGKSTLLKILSKVTGPTTGAIKAKGRIASLLEVGTGFHPELTGRDNIFLNGTILGMTKAEVQKKLEEIVDFAGVARYLDTPVKRYSSGMMVRLGFAVAAHLEPEILIVDEVLAVGDAEFQKKAIGKMHEVSEERGRTVIFVSHNMSSIKAICTKGLLIENGSISLNSEVDKVVTRYLKENLDSLGFQEVERKGIQTLFIKNIELKQKNITTAHINSLNPIEIVFFVAAKDNLKVDDLFEHLDLDVGINDVYGTRVAWMSTKLKHYKIKDSKFSIKINNFNLKPGKYSVNTFLYTRTHIIDWAKKIFQFEVNDSDYYDIKYRMPESLVLFDFEFS